MSDTVRQKAEAALAEVEAINAVVLPEPAQSTEIVPLERADTATSAEITTSLSAVRSTRASATDNSQPLPDHVLPASTLTRVHLPLARTLRTSRSATCRATCRR